MAHEATAHEAEGHGAPPRGLRRWLYSTNHKHIGTMYIVFAIVGGTVGTPLSIQIGRAS